MCQLWHFLSDDNDESQPVKDLKWMSCLICALHFYFFSPNCLILPLLSHITLSYPCTTFFFSFLKLCFFVLFFPGVLVSFPLTHSFYVFIFVWFLDVCVNFQYIGCLCYLCFSLNLLEKERRNVYCVDHKLD